MQTITEVVTASKYLVNPDRYVGQRLFKGVFKSWGIKKAVSKKVYEYAIDNGLPYFYAKKDTTHIYERTYGKSLTRGEIRKERDEMIDFLGHLHYKVGGMALPSITNQEKRNCPHKRIAKLEAELKEEIKAHNLTSAVYEEDRLAMSGLSDKLYTAQADLDVARNLITTLKAYKHDHDFKNLEKSAKSLIDSRTIKTLTDELYLCKDQLLVARENEVRVTDRLRAIRTALDVKTWHYPKE